MPRSSRTPFRVYYSENSPAYYSCEGTSKDINTGYSTSHSYTGDWFSWSIATSSFSMYAYPSARKDANSTKQNLPIIPPLLNAALLALLSTAIPLHMTLSSSIFMVTIDGNMIEDPSVKQLETAASIHALAFSSKKDLLMVESEGSFDIDTWEAVASAAQLSCCGSTINENVIAEEHQQGLQSFVRETAQTKFGAG